MDTVFERTVIFSDARDAKGQKEERSKSWSDSCFFANAYAGRHRQRAGSERAFVVTNWSCKIGTLRGRGGWDSNMGEGGEPVRVGAL